MYLSLSGMGPFRNYISLNIATFPRAYLPAKELETITLNEIISAVRSSGEDTHTDSKSLAIIPEINGIMKHIEQAIAISLDKQTLKDLVQLQISNSEKQGLETGSKMLNYSSDCVYVL